MCHSEQRVRQPPHVQVDERERDPGGGEVEVRRELRSGAEPDGEDREQQPGQELNERVPRADRRGAVAAAALQREPGDDGDAVAGSNGVPAGRAPRARGDDRLRAGEPPRHDVEERADDQPQYPGGDRHDHDVLLAHLLVTGGHGLERSASATRRPAALVPPNQAAWAVSAAAGPGNSGALGVSPKPWDRPIAGRRTGPAAGPGNSGGPGVSPKPWDQRAA